MLRVRCAWSQRSHPFSLPERPRPTNPTACPLYTCIHPTGFVAHLFHPSRHSQRGQEETIR